MKFYAIALNEARALQSDFRYENAKAAEKGVNKINETSDIKYSIYEIVVKRVR